MNHRNPSGKEWRGEEREEFPCFFVYKLTTGAKWHLDWFILEWFLIHPTVWPQYTNITRKTDTHRHRQRSPEYGFQQLTSATQHNLFQMLTAGCWLPICWTQSWVDEMKWVCAVATITCPSKELCTRLKYLVVSSSGKLTITSYRLWKITALTYSNHSYFLCSFILHDSQITCHTQNFKNWFKYNVMQYKNNQLFHSRLCHGLLGNRKVCKNRSNYPTYYLQVARLKLILV